MLDTIRLESPSITEELAYLIESNSIIRSGVDMKSGNVIYNFSHSQHRTSYDASIMCQVKRERFIHNKDSKQTYKVKCQPYLELECSLHKFALGHNIYGGSDDLLLQVDMLLTWLSVCVLNDSELPPVGDWIVKRLDYARVYKLGDSIDLFFEGFNNVYYPRRKCSKFSNTGLYFPGTYSTLKLYNKLVEFRKHDLKRLSKFMCDKKIGCLEEVAKGLLRIEIEVKSRKLKDMYNKLPTVKDINIDDIKNQFEVELNRIFKVSDEKVKIVNNHDEVLKRLAKVYSLRLSRTLYSTWTYLSIKGYDYVKDNMPKETFYRHIKQLKEAGITWNHSDIKLSDSKVIDFVFNPFTTSTELTLDLISTKKAV